MRCMLTALLLLLCASCFAPQGNDAARDAQGTVPVIYCTDLFHPHDDPDDHFDIACMYAIPELRIEAVVLDQGARQEEKPGRIPIEQLNHLTGRVIPWVAGLSQKLADSNDKGLDEPVKYQQGVHTILDVLARSAEPVTIITVGSVRDVAAAFNRDPDLCRRKVGMLMIFIGEARGGSDEYNVRLDPNAFVCVMNSGLPVLWVPCFDRGAREGERHCSYWKAAHADLLRGVSDPVFSFFAHALLRKDGDGIESLRHPVPPEERAQVLAGERNLWCTAIFTHAAGRLFVRRDGEWLTVPRGSERDGDEKTEIFAFTPVSVLARGAGEVKRGESGRAHAIRWFQVQRRDVYDEAMTSATRHLLLDLGREIAGRW